MCQVAGLLTPLAPGALESKVLGLAQVLCDRRAALLALGTSFRRRARSVQPASFLGLAGAGGQEGSWSSCLCRGPCCDG